MPVLIPATPARSLGFAPGSDRRIQVIVTSTGKIAMLRDGKVCEPQADPAIAHALALRCLQGDFDVMTADAMKAIALVLVAANMVLDQQELD